MKILIDEEVVKLALKIACKPAMNEHFPPRELLEVIDALRSTLDAAKDQQAKDYAAGLAKGIRSVGSSAENERLRKLILEAYVEIRYVLAGLTGVALRVAPNDKHMDSVIGRLAKLETALTPTVV